MNKPKTKAQDRQRLGTLLLHLQSKQSDILDRLQTVVLFRVDKTHDYQMWFQTNKGTFIVGEVGLVIKVTKTDHSIDDIQQVFKNTLIIEDVKSYIIDNKLFNTKKVRNTTMEQNTTVVTTEATTEVVATTVVEAINNPFIKEALNSASSDAPSTKATSKDLVNACELDKALTISKLYKGVDKDGKEYIKCYFKELHNTHAFAPSSMRNKILNVLNAHKELTLDDFIGVQVVFGYDEPVEIVDKQTGEVKTVTPITVEFK